MFVFVYKFFIISDIYLFGKNRKKMPLILITQFTKKFNFQKIIDS